jgi:hypothetical protein
VTSRHRLTDSDAEALLSGYTPPDRPDLAATAAFLRELPAQLSESEPIELVSRSQRRTRFVAVIAACVLAVVGLAGVVALRGDDHVVRPAVGGSVPADTATSSGSAAAPATPVGSATTVAQPSGATESTATTDPTTPMARYEAALRDWNDCVATKGAATCGPEPQPADYGVATPATNPPGTMSVSTVLQPSGTANGVTCPDKTHVPGLEHPDVMTC